MIKPYVDTSPMLEKSGQKLVIPLSTASDKCIYQGVRDHQTQSLKLQNRRRNSFPEDLVHILQVYILLRRHTNVYISPHKRASTTFRFTNSHM
jgi:hypothetical protein